MAKRSPARNFPSLVFPEVFPMTAPLFPPRPRRATSATASFAARLPSGKPLRYEANSATRRRSRRHYPQGTLTAQVRLCRAAGRAEAGRLVSAEGSRPEGRARPVDPPWRAGLPAARVLGGRPG
jgi:hypothetical protein